MLLQKENTNQPKPWMVDTKLQMAVCSWKMGWNFPSLFYVRLYSLNFFFLYNKVYFDQKKIFFKVLLQSFGSFFWYFQGWDGGKTDTIKWWFTAYEQVKGTGLWNRQPIYQTQRRGWIPASCAPWMPKAPKGNTTNLVNLTRLTWVPPRLEVFLIHSSQGDEPSLWLHAKLSAGNFPW